MRSLVVVALLLVAPTARADRKKAARASDPRVTVVDDEPVSRQATRAEPPPRRAARNNPSDPLDRGERREVVLEAPPPQPLRTEAVPVEERATPREAPPRLSDEPLSDAVAELAARQMRRNQPSIDACVAEASRRTPAAGGTVTLLVDVRSRKVRELRFGRDDLHDVELDACLVRAGRGWSFSLGRALFSWPVTLAPTAR